jgi:hypothetical protein
VQLKQGNNRVNVIGLRKRGGHIKQVRLGKEVPEAGTPIGDAAGISEHDRLWSRLNENCVVSLLQGNDRGNTVEPVETTDR